MRPLTLFAACLLLMAPLAGFTAEVAHAQTDSVPADVRARSLPRQRLSGPRFGFTTFTGDVARLRQAVGKESIMTQFGWQFETQIVSTREGNRALMEWVLLFGGVEQDELNVSLSWLAGYRLPNGIEFGAGPNLSVRKEAWDDVTTSMVIAGGATIPFGDLYVPVNLAVAFAEGGPRITTLLGWIVG